MDALDLACRAALCAVFLVAGLAKLRDREGTRAAVRAFGAPAWLAGPLPFAELATAALLVSPTTALAGAIAAAALLAAFIGAIAVSLARGRRPACRCFGQLSAQPVGARTLVRNAVLLAVAALLVALEAARPSPNPFDADGTTVAFVIAAAAVAGAAAVTIAVLRAYGQLLRRVDALERRLAYDEDYEEPLPEIGLRPGTPAPLPAALRPPEKPKRLLLVFTSPHCGPCRELLPEVARWQRTYADRLTIAVSEDELADAFEVNGTPSAVLVDHTGAVASWVAAGAEAIEQLLHDALRPVPVAVGEPAPELALATLDGDPFSLAALRGNPAAVVFWNPGCGFCRQMHEDLRGHEATVNGNGPALVIASSGDRAETTAEGFASTVVLDPDQALAGAFGATGTPMAVLLAPDGTVASGVAAGAAAVLDLLAPPGLVIHQRTRT